MRIVIVGVSTRAVAESAVRGGYQVCTVDYFGDRDQKALVENYSLLRDFNLPFSAYGLLEASRRLEFNSAMYISNLENHPKVVAELARKSCLLGNAPDVLDQVRDWRQLRQSCTEEGIPCAVTFLPGEEKNAVPESRWLRKPVRSGGGHNIRFWDGEPLDEAHVLQEYMEGRPASVAFVADGKRSVVIGLSEQLIGWPEMGARQFVWCGSLLPLRLDAEDRAAFLETVESMVARLTRRFGLRGVNGLDLVVANDSDGCPCPFLVEVNPRYTASMELVEIAHGLNIFSLHLEAMAGQLPKFSLGQHLEGHFIGKGIVFARRTLTVPEAMGGVEQGRRDIPFPGDRIMAARPVCTVLAEGDERESCLDKLLASARAVRREIGDE
jgi:predicted ATP-grasp superfamily ATP-dependent carboligase